MTTMRPSGRQPDQLRTSQITRRFTRHAEGSVLVAFGDTQVVCTVTVEERVPMLLKGAGQGWITAEYGMLPRSTSERMAREAARGKQSGRTQEIQRLIGRSLRCITDLDALGERQVRIDCDVLQADGGTRTAATTGAYVALHQAMAWLLNQGKLEASPRLDQVAAASCGSHQGQAVPDLDEYWQIVVVDPPRPGLGIAAVAAVTAASPRTIAYVSCDPAGLARDATYLRDAGYELEWAAPVDLFPQTFHIETVAKFSLEPGRLSSA